MERINMTAKELNLLYSATLALSQMAETKEDKELGKKAFALVNEMMNEANGRKDENHPRDSE